MRMERPSKCKFFNWFLEFTDLIFCPVTTAMAQEPRSGSSVGEVRRSNSRELTFAWTPGLVVSKLASVNNWL